MSSPERERTCVKASPDVFVAPFTSHDASVLFPAVFSSSSLQLDTTNDDLLVLQDDIVVQDASRGELYGRKGLYYELKADQNDTIRSIKDSKGKNKENATDMVIAYLSLHT